VLSAYMYVSLQVMLVFVKLIAVQLYVGGWPVEDKNEPIDTANMKVPCRFGVRIVLLYPPACRKRQLAGGV